MIKSLLTNKWFWIGVVAVIIILVNRNWYKIQRLFQPSDVNLEPGEPGYIAPEKKTELENLAQSLYNSIYGSHDNQVYDTALNLSDNELKYVSKFYRKNITQGTWLYTDIDDEVFSPWNDRDVRLMARLSKIGEKG